MAMLASCSTSAISTSRPAAAAPTSASMSSSRLRNGAGRVGAAAPSKVTPSARRYFATPSTSVTAASRCPLPRTLQVATFGAIALSCAVLLANLDEFDHTAGPRSGLQYYPTHQHSSTSPHRCLASTGSTSNARASTSGATAAANMSSGGPVFGPSSASISSATATASRAANARSITASTHISSSSSSSSYGSNRYGSNKELMWAESLGKTMSGALREQ